MKIRKPPINFLRPPILLAAWPGNWDVGHIAVDYLKTKLGAVPLAVMDMDGLFLPDEVQIKDGIIQPLDLPKSGFFFCHEPGIIFFLSEARLTGKENLIMLQTILKLALYYKVSHLFTFSAHPRLESEKKALELYFSCNSRELGKELITYGFLPMDSGKISGPEGLLPQMAAGVDMKSACIRASIDPLPLDTACPRASLEIIKALCTVFHFRVDVEELEDVIRRMDNILRKIENSIKKNISVKQDAEVLGNPGRKAERIPPGIFRKIEKLFQDVQKDKTRATELKKELDHWNLYRKYEDRFLGLFRRLSHQ
ncbi:PAC2 family protein [Fibrobacterota bacterium]